MNYQRFQLQPGDEGCKGAASDFQMCNEQSCPFFSQWSSFGACSVSCGGGVHTRSRECVGGDVGDLGCTGILQEVESCNEQPCPAWSVWAEWGECSQSCDGGFVSRSRTCVNGNQGMMGCMGDAFQTQPCVNRPCG